MAHHELSPALCGHAECGYGQRQEYCGIEASDPEGAPAVVVELLEEVLYRTQGTSSEHLYAGVDSGGFKMHRSLSYLHSDGKIWAWPLMSSSVEITHNIERQRGYNRYDVTVDWQVHQKQITPTILPITYTIETYREGAVQASIVDADVGATSSISRQMTEYDMAHLYELLGILDYMQQAEQQDNHRARVYLAEQQ